MTHSQNELPGRGSPNFEFPDIDGYVIELQLGEGAHGQVFKAIDMSLQKPVAIKVLNPIASKESHLRERFEREIKAYHSLKDGHVIQLRSHGRITQGAYKNCPYVIMEFMEGGTFGEWMSRFLADSKDSLRASIEILAEVCQGLAYLHEQGIVHRDLKPDNILLAEMAGTSDGRLKPGQVRLCDFGLIANLKEDRNLSRTGMGVGTPAYMSPEQFVDAKNITPASDQYAVGVMLYQLLCSRRPWQSSAEVTEPQGILEAKALGKTPCPPPSSSSGKIDGRLKEICLRCLEPNPVERYGNVTHIRESLEAWLNDEIDPHSRSWLKRTWRIQVLHPIRRRPGRFLLSIVATLLLSLVGYWTWYQCAHVWPSTSRFASVTNLEGIPVGIDSLRQSEAEKRHFHYQFVRDGWYGPLRKIYLRNRSNRIFAQAPLSSCPIEMFQHDPHSFIHFEITPFDIMGRIPVAWEYNYSASGELLWITELNSLGNPITRKQFESLNVAEYEEVDLPPNLGQATQIALNPSAKFGVRWGTDIEQVQFVWDEDGLCIRKMYFGRSERPTSDSHGAFGWEFERDSMKRVIKQTALGPNASPLDGVNGFATTLVEYKSNSELYTFLDANGVEVIRSDIGVSRIEIRDQTDGAVHLIRTYNHATPWASYFGGPETRMQWQGDQVQIEHASSESIPKHRGDGVHRVLAIFQEDGRIESASYFDSENSAIGPRNVDASKLRITYDQSNRIESLEMLDSTGAPKKSVFGASKYLLRWTAHGMPSGMALYHDDQAVLGRFGAHQTVLQYDEAQRLKSWSCFGLKHEEVDCLAGFHSRMLTYDSTGKVNSVSFWHPNRRRAVSGLVGYHRAVWSHDEKGNETAWESFDINDQPLTDADYGCHRIERQYDENSNETITICFDTKKARTLDTKGICEYRTTWVNGRKASTAAFNVDSTPMSVPGTTWHKWTHQPVQTENQPTHQFEIRYWNVAGEKVKTEEGYHLVKEIEDERGNVITGSYFDEDDEPVTHPDGYQLYRTNYDRLGRQSSGSAFDSRGEPILAWEGYHKWSKTYDSYGNEIGGEYFGTDSKSPIIVDGHCSWTASYSIAGKQLSWACFLPSGDRAVCDAGFHRWERTLNEKGQLSETVHFDASNNLLYSVARVESDAVEGLKSNDLVYGKNGKHDPKFVAQLLGKNSQSITLTPSLEVASKWLGLARDTISVEVIRGGRYMTIQNIKAESLKIAQLKEIFAQIK